MEGHETVVREYELDEKREMLVEVFNFGLGEGVYGATMGEAHWLPNGNILHNYGDEVRMREGSPGSASSLRFRFRFFIIQR